MAIARALITRPAVLFADEPTGALDTTTSREVLLMLRELVDLEGQTIVMVTHDPMAAARGPGDLPGRRPRRRRPGRPHRRADRRPYDRPGACGVLTVALSALRTRWATFVGSFVALAIGVGLMTTMTLGIAASLDPPTRTPQRFASSPVVVRGTDTLTVEVERGPNTARVSKKLAHPHPVDADLRKTYTTQPMVLITGVALLAPLLVRPVARCLRLPGAIGMLVRENTGAALRRTAAVAAPVLVTVALAGSLLGSAETVTASKAAEARARTAADLVVTGADLRPVEVPGATLSPSASMAVFVREEGSALIRSDARAVSDPGALAQVSRLPVVAGDVRDLDDRSIGVNEEWERHEVGQRVDVWLGDGRPATLRIVAVLALGTGDNGAYVTAANAPSAPVDRIDVQLADWADAGAVTSALRAGAGGRGAGGQGAGGIDAAGGTGAADIAGVAGVADWLAATHPQTSSKTRLGLWLVLGIALLYTAIALANTLLMANSSRSAELYALRLSGATRTQILRVVAGEALFAVAIGAILGAAVSAVNLAGLGAALATLSVPVSVTVPWTTLGLATGVCAAVAAIAALVSCPRGR
ncbi:FtsX-like permease family protein [Streptomyces sp. 21So2-11]|uniref:FtsX-like permease family protein n=1 Tax=Streptomyces sp. 21So2-11 TaxID=3144408 RepID=UPI00321A86C6